MITLKFINDLIQNSFVIIYILIISNWIEYCLGQKVYVPPYKPTFGFPKHCTNNISRSDYNNLKSEYEQCQEYYKRVWNIDDPMPVIIFLIF